MMILKLGLRPGIETKGLKFDHVLVLDGAWEKVGKNEDTDASRRLYYVAMSRAKQTLTLMQMPALNPFLMLQY